MFYQDTKEQNYDQIFQQDLRRLASAFAKHDRARMRAVIDKIETYHHFTNGQNLPVEKALLDALLSDNQDKAVLSDLAKKSGNPALVRVVQQRSHASANTPMARRLMEQKPSVRSIKPSA